MFKLAGRILDAYDDPAFVGNPQAAQIGLPDSAAIEKLPDRDFGIILKTASGTHRRYPLASPALVKVSEAYFNAHGHQLPADMQDAVRYHLKEAAARFNLTLKGEAAAPVSEYRGQIFVVTGEPLQIDEGLDKQAAFDQAQQHFIEQYGRMTPAERALAANHLDKVGEVTDPRIRDYIAKPVYGPNFASGIEQRAVVLRDDPIKLAQLQSLVASIRRMDPARGAVMLHQLDKTAGVSARVMDAFKTCWGGFEKVSASGARHDTTDRQFGVGTLSPETYQIETLARAHSDLIKQVFSDDIATAFLRNPIGYYSKASGQVKKTLKSLAESVGQKNPKSEVHTQAIPHVRGQIRTGDYTPWSQNPKC